MVAVGSKVSASETAKGTGGVQGGCTDADFTPANTSPEAAGNNPQSVAVGDFNLDGRPDLAVSNRLGFSVTILLNTCNTPPTITAQAVSQVADTSSNNKLIATVIDSDQPLQTLSVTISADGMNFFNMASLNGVSVSNIAVDSTGNVTATVAAACSATNAAFTLKVTDAAAATDTDTLTVTVTAESVPPTITCPPNKTQSNDLNQCGAAVTYPNATAIDNCPNVGTPSCSPSSGSFFPIGTTSVTCNVSDQSGNTNSCVFTVTVNDTQAPGLQCPADKTVLAGNSCPVATSAIVNYTAPPGTDNCAGVTAICLPPPGASLPLGTTTVTCKATDTRGNMTVCTFKVTVFNICLQDDANPNAKLFINSFTGQYRFSCGMTTFAGTGKMEGNRPGSCLMSLTHNAADRRARANWATTTMSGSASIQAPVGIERCTIMDRVMTDNNCNAP